MEINKKTLMHMLAENPKEIKDMFLEMLHTQDENGQIPLHLAVINRHIELVESFLEDGSNLETIDMYGETPLHKAVYNNKDTNIVSLLLEKKANPNKQNIYGETPLLVATFFNEVETVKLLVKYGADPKIPDKNNKLASDWATLEIAELLKGAKNENKFPI